MNSSQNPESLVRSISENHQNSHSANIDVAVNTSLFEIEQIKSDLKQSLGFHSGYQADVVDGHFTRLHNLLHNSLSFISTHENHAVNIPVLSQVKVIVNSL